MLSRVSWYRIPVEGFDMAFCYAYGNKVPMAQKFKYYYEPDVLQTVSVFL